MLHDFFSVVAEGNDFRRGDESAFGNEASITCIGTSLRPTCRRDVVVVLGGQLLVCDRHSEGNPVGEQRF